MAVVDGRRQVEFEDNLQVARRGLLLANIKQEGSGSPSSQRKMLNSL